MVNPFYLSFILMISLFNFSILKEVNHRPIIGILTLPYKNTKTSYVEDSYIKMVESSGARAVPIRWNSNKRIVDFLVNSVNGVLIQGDYYSQLIKKPRGLFGLRRSRFRSIDETAFYILSKAFELNKNGIYFPVWLDNYGFQFLVTNLSKNENIMDDLFLERLSTNLYLNDFDLSKNTEISSLISSSKNSTMLIKDIVKSITNQRSLNMTNLRKFKMFSLFDDQELNTIISNKTMYFDNLVGIKFENFYQSDVLMKHIIPTSFVLDRTGNLSVSSFEHKDFPFYGTLFQFDKMTYTVNEENTMDHSLQNIQINRKFADFFIEESKKNYQKFSAKSTESKIIFEKFKLRYDRKMKRYIYIVREEDDENENVIFN